MSKIFQYVVGIVLNYSRVLLLYKLRVAAQMGFCVPSAKIRAVVHVGPLSGVARRANQAPCLRINHNKDGLHGEAVDVCRHVMTQTATGSEPLDIKITKDAVQHNSGCDWESVNLVPDSTYTVVSIVSYFVYQCFR